MQRQTASKLLIDASVIIAAVLSPSGGSRLVFELAKTNKVKLVFTEQIIKEARLSLMKKYKSQELVAFYELLGEFKKCIFSDPTHSENLEFGELISDPKDYHVLAGAKKYNADYILTLDRKHFFTPKLKQAKLPFQILTPGEYLNIFKNET